MVSPEYATLAVLFAVVGLAIPFVKKRRKSDFKTIYISDVLPAPMLLKKGATK